MNKTKGNVVVKKMSVKELENLLNNADSVEQYRRWQVILLRTKNPKMGIKEIADMCQVEYRTVTQWTWMYKTGGAESLILSGKGGRYHCLMSKDEESKLLNTLKEKAEAGHIVTANSVKQVVEEQLGRSVNKDYAYNLLRRNKWRKVMPHTYHPNGNKESREAFKKTSQISWIPQSINLD